MFSHDRQHAGELREDERLVPLFDQLFDVRNEDIELCTRIGGGRLVEQSRVTRGLSQSEQRFENVHLGLGQALILDDPKQRVAVMGTHLVVQPLLIGPHLAKDRLFELFGKFAGHALLSASQDERLQAVSQNAAGLDVFGIGRMQFEGGTASQHAGVEELENGTEIAEMVLDRRAAQADTVSRFE